MIRKLFSGIPIGIAVIFVLIYFPFYAIDFWIYWLSDEIPTEFNDFRLVILCVFACLMAIFRISRFHPGFNHAYCTWLALSPWKFGKPLPRGTVFMNWSDAIILLVLTLLAYLNNNSMTPAPLVAYLAVSTLLLLGQLIPTNQVVFLVPFLFLFPFVFYPHRNIYIACIIAAALYGLACAGFCQWLKEFPWNTPFWNYDQRKELLEKAMNSNIIPWPYKTLRGDGPQFTVSVMHAFLICSLLTWWLHVAGWIEKEVFAVSYFLLFFIALLARTLNYLSRGLPPISIIGRISTGRLLIPGYDKIFIAPVCVGLVWFFMPEILIVLGVGKMLSYEISFFIFMMFAFCLPPSLKQWHFTGTYRLSFPSRKNQRVNRSSSDTYVSNLIRESFIWKS